MATSYFVKVTDSRGEFRWTFRAANHEPIAVSSEGYRNEADCDRGIALVQGSGSARIYRR